MNDWRHDGDRHKFRQRMETDRNYVIFLNLQRGDIYYYIKTVQSIDKWNNISKSCMYVNV